MHNKYLKNYQGFHQLRTNCTRASGGTSIFIADEHYAELLSLNTELECVAVSVWCPKKITICNIYIPPDNHLEEVEINDIIRQLPKPFILVGDFNAHNNLWGSENTSRKGKILEKVIDSSELHLLNNGEHTHFNISTGTFSSIDLSFCDLNAATQLDWQVVNSLYDSDHFPIMITDGTGSEPLLIERWNISRADWQDFGNEISTRWEHLTLSEDINEATKELTDTILLAANQHIGKTRIDTTKKTVPWWNEACKEAVKGCKRALNRYRRTRDMNDFVNFKRLKARSRRILKESKAQSWRSFVSTITSDTSPAQVWSNIKKMRGQQTNQKINCIKHDDFVITDSQSIAHIIAEFLHKKSINTIATTEMTPQEKVSLHPQSINSPFILDELKKALYTCKNSAGGPDNIPFIFLKKIPVSCLEKLLQLYNKIWTNHGFPSTWRDCIILPFKKNHQSPPDVKSFRPISLTCTMCKLMEKMINARMLEYLESNDLLNPYQFGFRKQRGTMDGLTLLQSEISNALTSQQEVVAVFFDIEAAFDTVSRSLIYNRLTELNLDGNLLAFIKNFLTNRTAKVSLNGATSHSFTLTDGVPQGAVLSPTLFNLAINNIDRCIPVPVKYSLYADDLVVYCAGKNTATTSTLIQNAVNNLQKWSAESGFKFAVHKTKVMTFSRKRRKYTPSIMMNSVSLEVVSEHRFLGLTLDSKLLWNKHIQNIKVECLNRMKVLKVMSHQQWGSSESILLRVYRALIRSRMDYGSFIYATSKSTKMLNTVQNAALRLSLGAFRTSPVDSLYFEAHEPPLSLRRQQLLLGYYARISICTTNPVCRLFTTLARTEHNIKHPQSVPQMLKQLLDNLDPQTVLPTRNLEEPDPDTGQVQYQNELKKFFKQLILNKWQSTWAESISKLAQLEINIIRRYNPNLNRRDLTVMRRVRIGHTRLTHSYLLDREDPPQCSACQAQLTCKHIVVECPVYVQNRQKHGIRDNPEETLRTPSDWTKIIHFLKELNLHSDI